MRKDNNNYVIKNAGWNEDIKPGEAVTFGFQVASPEVHFPTDYALLGVQQKVDAADYDIDLLVAEEWDTGKTIQVKIKNKTEFDIEDWRISMKSKDAIGNIWDAVIEEQKEDSYIIKNASYNSIIKAQGNVTFSYQIATDKKNNFLPEDIELISVQEVEAETTTQMQELTTEEIVTTESKSEEVSTTDTATTQTVITTESAGTTETNATTEYITTESVTTEENNTYDLEWNRKMINADSEEFVKAKNNVADKVKVAYLDSGIDYSSYINVVERKNFLSSFTDSNIIFDDVSGHGTAGAALLAGKTQEEADKEEQTEIEADTDEDVEVEDMSPAEDKIDSVLKEVLTVDYDTELEEVSDENSELSQVTSSSQETASVKALENTETEVEKEENSESEAATIQEGNIAGVNSNVEIYSARVLNERNEGKIDEIVEAIEWAIEKKVNIINIAWGTSVDSPKLKKAIEKANAENILIIAAAGNGEEVEYPAKYEEVMAVGSVNSEAKKADASAFGKEVEVVAPGQDVASYCLLQYLNSYSGTSFATAQVTGLASVLWQQDIEKSNTFIRQLLDTTANKLDDNSRFGLIDCESAVKNYSVAEQEFNEDISLMKAVKNIKNNDEFEAGEEIDGVVDETVVQGLWKSKQHEILVENIMHLRDGAIWNDSISSNLDVASEHPGFHGYYSKKKKEDYMNSYIYLTIQAVGMMQTGNILETTDYDDKCGTVSQLFKENIDIAWNHFKDATTKEQKALVIYGMALHTITDVFAHSTCEGVTEGKITKWKLINHQERKIIDENTGETIKTKPADATGYKMVRYECAKNVVADIINKHLTIISQCGDLNKEADLVSISAGSYDDILSIQNCNLMYIKDYDTTSKKREDYVANAFSIRGLAEFALSRCSNSGKLGQIDNDYVIKYLKNWHRCKFKISKKKIKKFKKVKKFTVYDKTFKKKFKVATVDKNGNLIGETKLLLNKKHKYVIRINNKYIKVGVKSFAMKQANTSEDNFGYLKTLDFSSISEDLYKDTEECSIVCLESEIELSDDDLSSIPIAGYVTNSDGDYVADAKVTLRDEDDEEYVTYTDSNGYYELPYVAPGWYDMYFEGTYETVHYSVVIYDIDHVEIEVIGDEEAEEDYYDDDYEYEDDE